MVIDKKNQIRLFEQTKVRTVWDENNQKWWFSVLDIIGILTDQPEFQKVRNYWKWLKNKLKSEGNETVSNTNQLKMRAEDGKMRLTDVADTEQILRLIQTIPSKKAEPFKMWLARVGRERIDETENPELSIDRAMENYLKKGYSKDWINQRLKTIEVRKELTDEWNRVGISKQEDFAILTNEITKAWSGKSVKDYKRFKGLKKENLRDNMTNLELVLNMLAEATTKEFSEKENPESFSHSKKIAKKGGTVAGNTRRDIEKQLGESIVSSKNAKEIHFKDKKKLEKKK